MIWIRPRFNHRLPFYLALSLLGLSCSNTGKGDSIGPAPGQNTADAGKDAGDLNGIGGGQVNPGGGIVHLDPSQVCKSISAKASVVPIDMYIMLDQSISMAETIASGATRWKAVTDAISAFVQDSRADGIGVGIDYFGVGYDSVENCKAENYAVPDVEIADLPGNKAALLNSLMNALGPASNSRTPTYAALDGALQHAKQHAQALADAGSNKLTVVVMASDGFPTECEQSLTAISKLASDAFNQTPQVRTYFISLKEGASNAESIAEKGGGKAFVITDQDDVTARFLDAMLSVTTAPLSCNYSVGFDAPDGGVAKLIDNDLAEVGYTSAATGQVTYLPLLHDSTGCLDTDKDGFYLTPSDNPTQLSLCRKTCSDLGAGTLDIKLGCVEGTVN